MTPINNKNSNMLSQLPSTAANKIKRSVLENKIVFIGIALLIVCNVVLSFKNNKPSTKAVEAPLQADTIIPAGYVLLPISLNNIESIKGLIAQFGVIDLYVSSSPQSPGKKLASRIKILKAPLNENEFAVLVSENLAETILKANGYFTGVVQNRFVKTSENIVQEKKSNTVNIEYNQESNL